MNYPDLAGKRVLITGATRGIGKEIAKSLAEQKAHIVFNYRKDEASAMAFQEELLSLGAENATAILFDVTDFETMKANLDSFVKEFGVISGLVNNAGISKDQLALRVRPEDIENVLNTNLKSAMVITNHLRRQFLKAKDISVVHMSSVVGLMGNSAQTVYAASKAYAKELAGKKIRSNVICPGFIETEMTASLDDKAKDKYIQAIPLGEYGMAKDVANLTLFLLSSASRYITGEVIKVDGGLYI